MMYPKKTPTNANPITRQPTTPRRRLSVVCGLLAIVFIFILNFPSFAQSVTRNNRNVYYVSPSGNDHWSGKLVKPDPTKTNGPFATLERARNAVRKLRQTRTLKDTVFIFIEGGDYYLNKTWVLSAQDSGTSTAPVIYKAYRHQQVKVIGGVKISGFKPVSQQRILHQLPEVSRKHLVEVNLRQLGITNFGQLTASGFGRPNRPSALELFYNHKPMTLARWPNKGWARVTSALKNNPAAFAYSGKSPGRWIHDPDVWLHGYWKQNWADSYVKVSKVDTSDHQIITQKPYGVYGYKKGGRYYALNIIQELDEPSEWYLDRSSGMLYFWPPKSDGNKTAIVSMINNLVVMKKVSHCIFDGIIFGDCRGNGMELLHSVDCEIRHSVIRNTGSAGIVITKGERDRVTYCKIMDTGDQGIILNGGDLKTLKPGKNIVSHCDITRFGRWDQAYRAGIAVNGVGNEILHNDLHIAPHAAILLGGNNNLIKYNNIYNVCRETVDAGAFYMGRNWTMRGNVLYGNYFHDNDNRIGSGQTIKSIYLDDMASGTKVIKNIFINDQIGVFIGGGKDNEVRNNFFAHCRQALAMDARGLTWAKKYASRNGGWHMYQKLKEVNYNKPPYSTEYPSLAKILNGNPQKPTGDRIRDNFFLNNRNNIHLTQLAKPELQNNKRVRNNLTINTLTEVKRALEKYSTFTIPIDSIGQ